jgi:hypothetical protein
MSPLPTRRARKCSGAIPSRWRVGLVWGVVKELYVMQTKNARKVAPPREASAGRAGGDGMVIAAAGEARPEVVTT